MIRRHVIDTKKLINKMKSKLEKLILDQHRIIQRSSSIAFKFFNSLKSVLRLSTMRSLFIRNNAFMKKGFLYCYWHLFEMHTKTMFSPLPWNIEFMVCLQRRRSPKYFPFAAPNPLGTDFLSIIFTCQDTFCAY